ncbi:MAG: nicotinate (nicotinamide) nucleotide adenylyltransferase [Robiginitomaculum sp.]
MARGRPVPSAITHKQCAKTGPTVGLFGGSFNPAHSGHLHVARCGLREAGLDQVWWLVSPGNPLKPDSGNYAARKDSVRALGLPPQMKISDMEQDFGTRYTIDMIRRAQKKWPRHNFVLLMGADNLRQLPKWKNWQDILHALPIVVVGRPGEAVKSRLGKAARMYSHARIPERRAQTIALSCTPRWTYLTPPLNSLSSSAIRRKNQDNC